MTISISPGLSGDHRVINGRPGDALERRRMATNAPSLSMNPTATHREVTANEVLGMKGDGLLVIDVRSEVDHKACRLPQSVHNCVYEISFMDRMAEILRPDEGQTVCVYGWSADTHEARMAAEKLLRAGYRDVLELRGGIEEWMAAGGEVDGQPPAVPGDVMVADGRREIDLSESRVEWIGRNLLNRHHGTLGMRAGYLEFRDGLPVGGEFVLDMNGINCVNLAGDPLHDVLVDHLRSHDFFDTELYPEATFRIDSTRRIGEGIVGSPNLRVEGTLTLKGITLPLSFDAVAGFTADGLPAAQATLLIDRTLWNVIYGSGRFFRNLGMHLVNDLIEVQLRMVVA